MHFSRVFCEEILRLEELDISFNDIGVDINDLLKHVKEVRCELSLCDCAELTSTGALEEVGGYADLSACPNLKEFPNIKRVAGKVYTPNIE